MAALNMTTEAWFEDCYISVSQIGKSEIGLCSKTTDMSISGGDFDIEGITTFCGKVTRVGSRNDIEISFDGIPVSVQDFDWIFHGTDPTGTAITSSSIVKNRVTFLWTNKTGVTSATEAITGNDAFRRSYAEAYCTNVEYNMTAGENLKATCDFKLATNDKSGDLNYRLANADTGSAISALSAYTTSNKF